MRYSAEEGGLPALITSSVIGEKAEFTNADALGLLDLTEDKFLLYYFYFVIHVRNKVKKGIREAGKR